MNKIFQQLKELQKSSLAPFSNYHVSCIVDTDKGEFTGINVELDVLNLGICAERNALYNSVTNGMRQINHIYLLTDSLSKFGTPCGACRQALSQFSNEETQITFFKPNGEHKTEKLMDLLPFMWSNIDLKK